MAIDPKALEQLSRDDLIAKARTLGAKRPELLTRPELRDEIIRLTEDDEAARRHARGWFGVARDLVASVVSQGLNLPDTADLIRGVNVKLPKAGPPVATVTLAEIYAAQGHVGRALTLLDEVLAKEPDHEAARAARERYSPAVSRATPIVSPEPEDDVGSAEKDLERAEPVTEVSLLDRGTEVSSLDQAADVAPQDVAPQDVAPQDVAPQDVAPISDLDSEVEPALGEVEPALGEVEPALGEVEPVSRQVPMSEAIAVARELEAPTPDSTLIVPAQAAASAFGPEERTVPSMSCPPAIARSAEASGAFREAADIDEDYLLLVRAPERDAVVLWQLGRRKRQMLERAAEPAQLALRILEVDASWDGPICRESIIELSEPLGHRFLKPSVGEERVALGWLKSGKFTAICVGAEFSWDKDTGAMLVWAPPVSKGPAYWHRLGAQRIDVVLRANAS